MSKRTFRILAAGALGVALAFVVPSISHNTAIAAPEHKHGESEKHKLGKMKVGTVEVSVITIGEVEAGGHVDFDIKVFTPPAEPKALRVWIGTQDAAGSTKADGKKDFVKEGSYFYKGEVQVPKTIPAGAKLWVEIETDSGTQSAGWNYDVHDHKH